MGDPKPRKYMIRHVLESGQPTYVYGGRGTLKSLACLTMGLAVASPEVSSILGYAVEEHGPVIFFDSELSRDALFGYFAEDDPPTVADVGSAQNILRAAER